MDTDALSVDPAAPDFGGAEAACDATPQRHRRTAERYTEDRADDVTLMYRFQEQADYRAFETLFERHKRGLLAFLVRLSGDYAVAEDVSQHTWLKLIDGARRRAYTPREGASFQTYLYTLARNRFVDEHVRRHEVSRTSTNHADLERIADMADERGGPEAAATSAQLKALMEKALRQLPFEQREVIALWSAGLDLETMVKLVGAPRDTVLSRKKYAIAKLRTALARLGATPERA